MDQQSVAYLAQHPRVMGAVPVLSALGGELAQQVPAPQLRALLYAAGRRLARLHSVGTLKTLGEFSLFAQKRLSELDLGWVRIEETAGAVDFVHGCAPLLNWFGPASEEWAPGLLEGLYAEWMAQLGADDRLDVREIEDQSLGEFAVRLRFAHESTFGA